MKPETAKRKYKGQFIAFAWKGKDEENGKVLYHDRDETAFNAKAMTYKGRAKNVHFLFAGKIPLIPKGWEVFLCTR